MLHMLYSYIAEAILVCCMNHSMGDILIEYQDASGAQTYIQDTVNAQTVDRGWSVQSLHQTCLPLCSFRTEPLQTSFISRVFFQIVDIS